MLKLHHINDKEGGAHTNVLNLGPQLPCYATVYMYIYTLLALLLSVTGQIGTGKMVRLNGIDCNSIQFLFDNKVTIRRRGNLNGSKCKQD